MLTFTYKARDESGAAVTGTTEARSQSDAVRQLQRQSLTVTDIKAGSTPINPDQVLVKQASKQVKRDEVISFAGQLGVMLETGVNLGDALDAFVKQSKGSGLRRVVEVVNDRVTGGTTFSQAMAEFPRVFPNMMISLMRASEASGTMALMLGRIAQYLSKERKTQKQITGALTYPLVMVGIAVAVTIFLVIWVLPRFAKIYSSREAALPTATRLVIQTSDFLIAYWPHLAVGLVASTILFLFFRASDFGRRFLDMLKIRLPIIGPMYTQFYLTRSTRTLATLLASGVTLLEAVRIVRTVTDNTLWNEFWQRLENDMTAGKSITDAITSTHLIPPAIAQMIAAGERTGRLPEVLDRVALSTEEDLDQAVKNATQLIEPAMIVFMGLTIGGIAISLLLPIFTISNVMSQ